jgi:hypothetical protein
MNDLKNAFRKFFDEDIIEYHRYEETAYVREKYWIQEYDSYRDGLNMNKGGGGGKVRKLPLYDIASLISLGCNLRTIHDILNNNYEDIDISINPLLRRVRQFFGSWYEAQLRFLKPVIEELYEEGYTRYDIYRAMQYADSPGSWFKQWAKGNEFLYGELEDIDWENVDLKKWDNNIDALIYDIKAEYYGIPRSQWYQWLLSGITILRIADMAELSRNRVESVYKDKFNSLGFSIARRIAQQDFTLNNRYKVSGRIGWAMIYNQLFGKLPDFVVIQKYFEDLFRLPLNEIDKLSYFTFSQRIS